MIEINLLPEDKRARITASAGKAGDPAKPVYGALKKLVYIVPAAAAALLIVHAYLTVVHVTASVTLSALEKRLQAFQPQMKRLAGFRAEFENAGQDERVMQDLAKAGIDWSKKLNLLSLDLPSGVWINDLSVTPRQLAVKCSVVSLDADPLDVINRFLSTLKDDAGFFSDFTGFDLGSVQKRVVGSYEIADFTVTMEAKPR